MTARSDALTARREAVIEMPVTPNGAGTSRVVRAAEIFGKNTFNDRVMREKLPKESYRRLLEIIRKGEKLDRELANTVAHAMKEWALENNVTHFTHWFQPHDRFDR